MQTPRFITIQGEVEWPSHLELEDVEAVPTAADLDKKPAAPIPNPQDYLVDLHP